MRLWKAGSNRWMGNIAGMFRVFAILMMATCFAFGSCHQLRVITAIRLSTSRVDPLENGRADSERQTDTGRALFAWMRSIPGTLFGKAQASTTFLTAQRHSG